MVMVAGRGGGGRVCGGRGHGREEPIGMIKGEEDCGGGGEGERGKRSAAD